MERLQEFDPSFVASSDGKFISDLVSAYKAKDVDAFTKTVVDYDIVKRLEPWATTMLLKIKQKLYEL